MNAQDIATLQQIVTSALQNADAFNKVWIAGAAVIASLFAIVIGAVVQLYVSRVTRRAQAEALRDQLKAQAEALHDQLKTQELASRRVSAASISAKRHAWIDDLRQDMATYLAIWQDLAHRWNSFVARYIAMDEGASQARIRALTEEFERLTTATDIGRREADEVHCRILLRLNPKEPMHATLEAQMLALQYAFEFSDAPDATALNEQYHHFVETRKAMITNQRAILKKEWEYLKTEIYVNPIDPTASAASASGSDLSIAST